MKIFTGGSNSTLAQKVVENLGTQLANLEVHVFPDEEKRYRVVDSVVGQDCAVIQSTSTRADRNYMELFFIVDALSRSGAKSVTVVMPYMGYQRQDHVFRDGEAVSLEVAVKTLEAVGVTKLISFDLHSIKIPEMFKIPVTHLSALPLFAQKIKEMEKTLDHFVLITPDMGGIRRIKILSELLDNMPYASIVKNRDLVTGGVEAKDIELPKGTTLSGKTVVIVDDMISSGGTIVKAAQLLRKNGVAKTYVFATHPVLSQNSPEILQEADVEKVYVTDTIAVSPKKRFPKLDFITVADMIAKEISKS
ncbi:MAG TPA: ribose-phosphate pyrophosphokinase [Candidatus Saccharimonadales bacterium]|nr:ribose-phosphate pyrophosphokinase [Candidatus Saccharimonadales bacterium]